MQGRWITLFLDLKKHTEFQSKARKLSVSFIMHYHFSHEKLIQIILLTVSILRWEVPGNDA